LEASWAPSGLACSGAAGAPRICLVEHARHGREGSARVKSWLRLPQKARRAGGVYPPARGPAAAPGSSETSELLVEIDNELMMMGLPV